MKKLRIFPGMINISRTPNKIPSGTPSGNLIFIKNLGEISKCNVSENFRDVRLTIKTIPNIFRGINRMFVR